MARLESAVDEQVKAIPKLITKGHELFVEEMTTKRRQPALAAIMVSHFLASLGDSINDRSFRPDGALFILTIATTVVDELDRAIRG